MEIQERAKLYFKRFGVSAPHASQPLQEGTKVIITIPSHNEPDTLKTLDSLATCIPPTSPVEVLVILNHSEIADAQLKTHHKKVAEEIKEWQAQLPKNHFLRVQPLLTELPAKHAGVGLARKLVMDEAFRLFAEINYDGLIVCLDADCTVEANYLWVLEAAHLANPLPQVFTLYFEHRLPNNSTLSEGILYYELFLRYYIQALRYAKFPFAMHTIGSSMACSAAHYAAQGGMNRRKAGEDFYFLHKITPHAFLHEIVETTVYPSARVSERVPFGTGRAQQEWQAGKSKIIQTYPVEIFSDLKVFFEQVPNLLLAEALGLPTWLSHFLEEQNFTAALARIRKSSTSPYIFNKNFWAWFDGFKVLKAVHYARDNHFGEVPLEKAAKDLFAQQGAKPSTEISVQQLLDLYRRIDGEGYV